MKNILITLLSMLIPSSVIMAQYQNVQEKASLVNVPLEKFVSQQKTLFNFDWKFQLVTEENKGTNFAAPALDDSSWRILDLPHDFQFEQPWTKAGGGARGFKPMCEGWYRKSFQADPLWKGKRVVMDFGGIIYLGDVYLNGHKIASTDYGYVGIEADLTPYLHFEKENIVAVYASTGPKKGSRWYTGGGLFRDVYLQVQNPTHIARHGIYITTPEVASDKATVAVQVEVDGWQKHNVSVRTTVRNPEGKVVGSAHNTMPKHTHQTCTELKLPAITLKNPQLWSCNTPQLYSADVVVVADGMVVDSITEQFGIRKLEFSPEFGFKLNGEKIFLQGNANHHDLGALGAASYDRAIERMMLQLKAFGYNTIRCSHNPYSDSFARIADRVGMLIVDELTDKWSDNDYWGGRRPFTQIWSDLIIEWIKRDRNRPSIIHSFFDHTMHPYPQAYLIKSAFMPDVPEVHIGVVDAADAESVSWNDVIVGRMTLNERWNYEPGSKQSLFTYTNAHSVELLVNGKSIGTQLNDTTKINLRNMIYWKDVPYGNGGSLEAIARDKNGNEVDRHRIESAEKAVALKIEAETPTDWKADGMDLQYINVTAVDKKGRPVWTYNEPLTLQIEGSARLVALDNSDHYTSDLFNGITTKRMHQGRMQIILRSNREAGEVKLKVTSVGLKGTLRLKTIIN